MADSWQRGTSNTPRQFSLCTLLTFITSRYSQHIHHFHLYRVPPSRSSPLPSSSPNSLNSFVDTSFSSCRESSPPFKLASSDRIPFIRFHLHFSPPFIPLSPFRDSSRSHAWNR